MDTNYTLPMDSIHVSNLYLLYKNLRLTQKIAFFCCVLLFITILFYVAIFRHVLSSELYQHGNGINPKYALLPQVNTQQDPRIDGILLGLGLAKTGTTSLYITFCRYSLLNANCGVKRPEDKYWHRCIWNHFQSEHEFQYNMSHILDTIDNSTFEEDCSIEGWSYFSFVLPNPRESHRHKTSLSRRQQFFLLNETYDKADDYKSKSRPYFVRGYHVKTTNHFGSIYIPHILHYAVTKRAMNLKFYVTFRNPMSRILSSYIFMVGYEKKYIPKRFADINAFINNDINNANLINIINILNDANTSIWHLNWKYIFQQWIFYEANTRKQCFIDRKYLKSISNQITKDLRAGKEKIGRYQQSKNQSAETQFEHRTNRKLFAESLEDKTIDPRHRKRPRMRRTRSIWPVDKARIGFTCERDVFRSTVGDSCFVIPLMFWINIFGKEVMFERLRILQFELLTRNMDEYVAELLCFWEAKTCGMDIALADMQRKRRRLKKDDGAIRIATTFRYQDNKNYPEFIVDGDMLNEFDDFFKPCNRRLNQLLTQDMPGLMLLDEFDIGQWDFIDS